MPLPDMHEPMDSPLHMHLFPNEHGCSEQQYSICPYPAVDHFACSRIVFGRSLYSIQHTIGSKLHKYQIISE